MPHGVDSGKAREKADLPAFSAKRNDCQDDTARMRTRGQERSPVAAPGHLSTPEQGFRFFDFGQISLRVEVSKNCREHLGYCLGSAIRTIEVRKSNCAAQLERLCPLGSGDFQGSAEGVLGHGNVRWVKMR